MSYAGLSIANNPKAYYRLGEASGTTVVDSMGLNNATYNASGVTYGVPGPLIADPNTAVFLDGAAGYIALPSAINPAGLSAFSVALWFNPAALVASTFHRIISNANTGSSNVGIDMGLTGSSGTIFFNIGNGTTNAGATSSMTLSIGTWYFIVGTYDGSNIRLYINGSLQATTALAGTIGSSASMINIGRNPAYTGDYMAGIFSETEIYYATLSQAQISALYNAATVPAFSVESLNVYKTQQVLVFSPSGQFIDTWSDAPLLAGFKETMNAATTPIQVELPRPFDNFDLAGSLGARGSIGQGNIVKYYLYGPGLPSSGLLRYQGVIDGYAPQIKENGQETVVVTLTPQSSALGDRALAAIKNFGTYQQPLTYVDVVSMFNWFFQNNDPNTGNPYTYPLTLAAGNPSSSGKVAQYSFQNQTLLSMFQTILLMLPPNWFFRVNPDFTTLLNVAPTTAQHTVDLAQHVINPQYNADWSQLKNIVFFTGVGATNNNPNANPNIQVPLITATAKGSDVSIFGARYQFANDSRVQDQNTANTLAQGLLNALDRYTLRTKLRIPDYRGDIFPGVGYDIESLRVGDTIQLVNMYGAPSSNTLQALWDQAFWDMQNWDAAYLGAISPVVQIVSIDYNWYFVDVELGALQPNQDLALFRIQQAFSDFTMI